MLVSASKHGVKASFNSIASFFIPLKALGLKKEAIEFNGASLVLLGIFASRPTRKYFAWTENASLYFIGNLDQKL